MRIIIVENDADLYQFPLLDCNHPAQSHIQFTIGDLHGNALKLIYFLIRQNIMVLKNGIFDYEKLRDIYLTPADDITFAHIDRFNEIVLNASIINHPLIRFLGDELADRGQNDYLTLKIIEKLATNHVPLEFMLSNHGIEFVRVYENGFTDFKKIRVRKDQRRSIATLGKLLKYNLITIAELNAIVEKYYLPNLKIVSYSIDPQQHEISIYTHAPVGLTTIKALADKCHIKYSKKSISSLAQSLEDINHYFQQVAQQKMIYEFSGLNDLDKAEDALFDHPVVRVIWHRTRRYTIPSDKHGYHTLFVHGHNKRGVVDTEYETYVINLDNMFGKANQYKGTYRVLYSDDCDLQGYQHNMQLVVVTAVLPTRSYSSNF